MNYAVKLPALISSIRWQALHLGLSRKKVSAYLLLSLMAFPSCPSLTSWPRPHPPLKTWRKWNSCHWLFSWSVWNLKPFPRNCAILCSVSSVLVFFPNRWKGKYVKWKSKSILSIFRKQDYGLKPNGFWISISIVFINHKNIWQRSCIYTCVCLIFRCRFITVAFSGPWKDRGSQF